MLYDLFEKLDSKRIVKAILNHVKRMLSYGKIPKVLDLVIDNLFLDFKLTVFGRKQTEILRRKLSTLIRQIIDVSAIVYYVRKMLIVEFENPPPLMLNVLSALT